MHLKEARAKGKMEQFIKEHEKTHPRASKHHLYKTIEVMALGKKKPKRGTSRKASRAD